MEGTSTNNNNNESGDKDEIDDKSENINKEKIKKNENINNEEGNDQPLKKQKLEEDGDSPSQGENGIILLFFTCFKFIHD